MQRQILRAFGAVPPSDDFTDAPHDLYILLNVLNHR